MPDKETPAETRRGERWFIIVLILFSALALWQAWKIAGFSALSSPGVFPMLAAGIMLVCALCSLRDHRHTARALQPDNEPLPSGLPDDDSVLPLRVLLVMGLLSLYVLAMPWLGFLLDSGVFLMISLHLLWRKPLWQTVSVSLLSLLIIHVLFRQVFQVILPDGVLLDLLH